MHQDTFLTIFRIIEEVAALLLYFFDGDVVRGGWIERMAKPILAMVCDKIVRMAIEVCVIYVIEKPDAKVDIAYHCCQLGANVQIMCTDSRN